mmetsp:Transcript_47413/g.62740  ORF Transcript_47413/g.62740 Transcript_47413/m.62740 type:complete len:214 (-) Transcript_47413:110-751(-)
MSWYESEYIVEDIPELVAAELETTAEELFEDADVEAVALKTKKSSYKSSYKPSYTYTSTYKPSYNYSSGISSNTGYSYSGSSAYVAPSTYYGAYVTPTPQYYYVESSYKAPSMDTYSSKTTSSYSYTSPSYSSPSIHYSSPRTHYSSYRYTGNTVYVDGPAGWVIALIVLAVFLIVLVPICYRAIKRRQQGGDSFIQTETVTVHVHKSHSSSD